MGRDADVEFLIAGFCPSYNEILVYKFELVKYDDKYEVIFDEILQEQEDIELLGSGKPIAEKLIDERMIESGQSHELLNILRDICVGNEVPSVGGFIQYGDFLNRDFTIYGILDYEITSTGQLNYLFTYRGIPLYQGRFEMSWQDFHINVPLKRPFDKYIDEYLKEENGNI